MDTSDGHKKETVHVCGSLSQKLSDAVISNAHTPLITYPVCDWVCVLDGTVGSVRV